MDRKLLPLALMYADDGEPIEGRTRLQKLVFLMQKRIEEDKDDSPISDCYNFIAYDYGPFSKDLYDDLDDAIEKNFVRSETEPISEDKEKYIYEIENSGKDWIENHLSEDETKPILQLADNVKNEYGDVYLSNLINEVYSRYPEYAENSIY